jgi:hypothetical protein
MRSFILACAAVLPVLDGAVAQDLFSTLQFPGVVSSRQIYGDAAPRSVVKKPRNGLDFSSTSSIGKPSRAPRMISSRYIYGDASPPTKIYNAPKGIGHSSGASMIMGGPTKRGGTSPRILYGN